MNKLHNYINTLYKSGMSYISAGETAQTDVSMLQDVVNYLELVETVTKDLNSEGDEGSHLEDDLKWLIDLANIAIKDLNIRNGELIEIENDEAHDLMAEDKILGGQND